MLTCIYACIRLESRLEGSWVIHTLHICTRLDDDRTIPEYDTVFTFRDKHVGQRKANINCMLD